ncbi:hypothetical protein QR685DRAFT_334469 [Neurospora intermedia]|uniref:Uncharacterized protein n=1 Tax=Neurospora intermedia TaxID=5142 RepID=A0ABR3D7I9_NEUIN
MRSEDHSTCLPNVKPRIYGLPELHCIATYHPESHAQVAMGTTGRMDGRTTRARHAHGKQTLDSTDVEFIHCIHLSIHAMFRLLSRVQCSSLEVTDRPQPTQENSRQFLKMISSTSIPYFSGKPLWANLGVWNGLNHSLLSFLSILVYDLYHLSARHSHQTYLLHWRELGAGFVSANRAFESQLYQGRVSDRYMCVGGFEKRARIIPLGLPS